MLLKYLAHTRTCTHAHTHTHTQLVQLHTSYTSPCKAHAACVACASQSPQLVFSSLWLPAVSTTKNDYCCFYNKYSSEEYCDWLRHNKLAFDIQKGRPAANMKSIGLQDRTSCSGGRWYTRAVCASIGKATLVQRHASRLTFIRHNITSHSSLSCQELHQVGSAGLRSTPVLPICKAFHI